MKTYLLTTLIALGFTTASAQAASKCFLAQNPETLSVEIASDDQIAKPVVEAIVRATLKTTSRQDADIGTLRAHTATGKVIEAEAFRTSGDPREEGVDTYLVECDGGGMDVLPAEGKQVLLKTNRLRADIEGCDGTATLKTGGTIFNQISCQ